MHVNNLNACDYVLELKAFQPSECRHVDFGDIS
jgi:hypothetical protein